MFGKTWKTMCVFTSLANASPKLHQAWSKSFKYLFFCKHRNQPTNKDLVVIHDTIWTRVVDTAFSYFISSVRWSRSSLSFRRDPIRPHTGALIISRLTRVNGGSSARPREVPIFPRLHLSLFVVDLMRPVLTSRLQTGELQGCITYTLFQWINQDIAWSKKKQS